MFMQSVIVVAGEAAVRSLRRCRSGHCQEIIVYIQRLFIDNVMVVGSCNTV